MMLSALQLPCITGHYYPETREKILKICQNYFKGYSLAPEATCCGLPYFEKGELKTAKKCGEYNLGLYTEKLLLCPSSKCGSVYKIQYPRIFNNTVSHNAAFQLSRNVLTLKDLLEKLSPDQFEKSYQSYFLVSECCSEPWLREFVLSRISSEWKFPILKHSCCGAGTSMPVSDPDQSFRLSLAMLDEFRASGADIMVFEDDICRKHCELCAETNGFEIKTKHILDLVNL